MASESNPDVHCVGKNIPRTKRKLQKHLRSAGLAYVSRTGKIIPAKQVAEELCQCPQKCNDRVPMYDREQLFKFFYQTLGEAESQNKFLREHMDVRARAKPPVPDPPPLPGTRPPRRITCKYLLPRLPSPIDKIEVCQKAFCSAFVISTKRVRLQREKLIHSLGLNSYHHQKSVKKKRKIEEPIVTSENTILSQTLQTTLSATTLEIFIENCNRDLGMDVMEELRPISNEIEIKIDRPTQIQPPPMTTKRSIVDDPLIPMGISVPEGVTIAPVTATPDHDRDIAIVNNFFYNQLWKPEYIGAHS